VCHISLSLSFSLSPSFFLLFLSIPHPLWSGWTTSLSYSSGNSSLAASLAFDFWFLVNVLGVKMDGEERKGKRELKTGDRWSRLTGMTLVMYYFLTAIARRLVYARLKND